MVERLLHAYRDILTEKQNSPDWAVRKRNNPNELVRPTVPFVGKHYAEQKKKILVYASAENLADYYVGNTKYWVGDWLDDDAQAENRHRKCFDDPTYQSDPFFPHVHLGPMNNGCLATAAYYIVNRLYQREFESARDFYETISFGNYGKYSIETELQRSKRMGQEPGASKANIDYAGDKELMSESHSFIKADLEVLEPDCIILPKAMYNADREFIIKYSKGALIIPIYQINTSVINRIIAKAFPQYDIGKLPKSVRRWYDCLHKDGMKGKSKENYLSVFTYLDHVIEKAAYLKSSGGH